MHPSHCFVCADEKLVAHPRNRLCLVRMHPSHFLVRADEKLVAYIHTYIHTYISTKQVVPLVALSSSDWGTNVFTRDYGGAMDSEVPLNLSCIYPYSYILTVSRELSFSRDRNHISTCEHLYQCAHSATAAFDLNSLFRWLLLVRRTCSPRAGTRLPLRTPLQSALPCTAARTIAPVPATTPKLTSM